MFTLSELPPDASEAERLCAAQAAIALLREQRKAQRSAAHTQAATREPVQIAAPAPPQSAPRYTLPSVAATTRVERPYSIEATASISSASAFKATASTRWASGLLGLCIAAVFAIGGFIVGRITVPVVSGLALGIDEDRAQQTKQQLLKDNQFLVDQIADLQAETTTLQEQLLALELQALTANSTEYSVNRTLPETLHEDSTDPNEVAVLGNAEVLATANIDHKALPTVQSAFNRSLDRLAEIDALYEKGTYNYADREQSRRQVREQLVEDIGLQAFLAEQHALGKPNRLLVSDIAPIGLEVPIESGDVLLSINGQRVVDLEQLRWVENDILDTADDSGISGNNHVLEVLRNGERVAIAYDLPLEILLLDQDSVKPSLLD